MSSIAAGITSTSALVYTGDTSGDLQLQVNGTTPGLTISAAGALGLGSSVDYGTAGKMLVSSGTGAAPTWVAPGPSTAKVYFMGQF